MFNDAAQIMAGVLVRFGIGAVTSLAEDAGAERREAERLRAEVQGGRGTARLGGMPAGDGQ